MTTKIAVIIARGGSKRIPRKNIRPFAGRPIIAYPIDTAIQSQMFDRVIVSTEDQEIAQIAQAHGAEIPFMRATRLADDFTGTTDVVIDAIQQCQTRGIGAEIVCCLYPCTPFLTVTLLQETYTKWLDSGQPFGFPVIPFPSLPQRGLGRYANGKMYSYYPQYQNSRTQDLETLYYDAGQFYWGQTSAWLTSQSIHQTGYGHIISPWSAVDIDTLQDWHWAEMLHQSLVKLG